MSKAQTRRDFACVHGGCAFKTDKRKAIYTHLVRTHSERKEDYECEYCDTLFEEEAVIEEHLYTAHPGCQFRYTCVSRLENILNRCAQLATDRKNAVAMKKNASPGNEKKPVIETNIGVNKNAKNDTETKPDAQYAHIDNPNNQNKQKPLKESSLKRKTSVNESLNNLAKLPRIIPPEPLEKTRDEYVNDQSTVKPDVNASLTEDETSEFISKPSGLKIKLNLKKIRDSCSRESSAEPHTGNEEIGSASDLREMSPLDESDLGLPQVESPITQLETTIAKTDNVKAMVSRSAHSPTTKSKSSYLENLEVYHTTDELNRRCCPFCDYKTTKNTIRVHLSGKHRIYFVMCSRCDYRAAFPYQVQAHGFSSHKVKNIEVIHLAKSYREGVIAGIKAEMAENHTIDNNHQKPDGTAGDGNGSIGDSPRPDLPNTKIKPPQIPPETRMFKPPVCQTTKTDYYNIIYENGTYLYCCNQCEFRTPVRATIYTHKYRHEDRAYTCGYCEFVSSPRSNVAHHIRVRHKGKAFIIDEIGTDQLKLSNTNDDPMDVLESGESAKTGIQTETENVNSSADTLCNNLPPAEMSINVPTEATVTNPLPIAELNENETSTNAETNPKMIIKVPEYKRTLTTFVPSRIQNIDAKVRDMKEACVSQNEGEHKLSINKLYRYNPKGSPKYLCIKCPYACDTHPKMKHHLYRHKPQRYKCPYCNHRKYPRSYVVRHIRDTHRDKPMTVIDLVETGEIENDPDDNDVLNESDDMNMDIRRSEDMNDSPDQGKFKISQGTRYVLNDPTCGYVVPVQKQEDMTNEANFAQDPDLMQMNSSVELKSPSISNIPQPIDNSTPITDSALFDLESKTPQSSYRKPVKNYDVDTKRKPRYICNFCQYGTENYKTIHNHMYRHERVKFRCPYCGFKRAPRSAVENHIREVHKGQPIITTEVVDEEDAKLINNVLSGDHSLKRKDPSISDTPSSRFPRLHEQLKSDDTSPPSVLWQTKKASTKVNTSSQDMPQLQIPVKPKTPGSSVSHIIPNIAALTKPLQNSVGPPNVTISSSSPIPFPQKQTSSPPIMSVTPTIVKKVEPRQSTAFRQDVGNNSAHNANSATPSYKDGGKTTFKTMYKCVFNTEICNHIAKDRSKMKQHLFMHVEYKPWSCDYCNMTASQSSHVKNHVRSEHPREEISFQYKQHNYLEKHIETFLQKGVFTVPVNEYRSIMDMKGSTQKSQYDYSRDVEGYLLCPHCDYRTKSGGMSDHIKMKHKHPRFKCHWCDYKAFYRSEIRKHHRKERGHVHLEFMTEELDLADVLDDNKEGEIPEALQGSIIASTTSNGSVEATTVSTRDISQALEYDGDTSSDADSAISDSTALSNNLSDSSFLHLSLPYSFENIDGNGEFPQLDDTQTSDDIRLNQTGTHDTASNSQIGRKSAEYLKARKGDKTSLYKCGYCMFSAHLRTMVKIHCQKQHPYKKVHVAELNKKNKHISKNRTEGAYKSETNDCANGAKGNSFNKHVGEESQLSNEDLMSKIAPLLRKDNTTSGNQMMVAKKSKTLKSVIDLLSSKVQCSENGGIPCETSVSSTNEVNSSPLNDSQVKLTQNAVHEEKSAVHSSSRKQRKPQHVIPNVIDDPDNNENVKSSCGVYPKCSSVSCEDVLDSASCEDALKDSINCANGPTADILCCENGPPVLTKALCDADVSHSDSIKEIDITPPLLVNEIAKVADVV